MDQNGKPNRLIISMMAETVANLHQQKQPTTDPIVPLYSATTIPPEIVMKTPLFGPICSFVLGALLLTQFGAHAQFTVQRNCNTIGTGSNAWHYLMMEGESYIPESKLAAEGSGFAKLWDDEALTSFYTIPMLATNTGASMKGALGTIGPASFSRFADKVTYGVVFSDPGDYYLYMRFTMFENGGNLAHYISEDSFFLPPDFNKDPETDWVPPGTTGADNGGYTEGFGATGFLLILDYQGNGSRTDRSGGANTNYWEGQFHWNQLFVSSFLSGSITNEDGSPRAGNPFHYVVTPAMVGTTQYFTIAYREQGVTIDSFLFSTKTNLLNDYQQTELDELLVNKVQVQDANNVVPTSSNSWAYLIMEAEDFNAKSNRLATSGFTAIAPGSTNVAFYTAPLLATNTTASHKGALYTQSPGFGRFSDFVNYTVQFATPGDYYLYMRFTMYENGGNLAHYISEDSFILPPDFNQNPQTGWDPPGTAGADNGGYTEGFGATGFLLILDYQGNGSRTDRSGGANTNYWEGQFHWNQLFVSSFLSGSITNADGSPRAGSPFHYVVTPAMTNTPLNFTIAFRESGVTPDLFLFSTYTNLLNDYTQEELDQLLLHPKLSIASSGTNVVLSWAMSACGYILESSTSLSGPWTTVQTPSAIGGTRYNVTIEASGAQAYFRLRQP
jgi:hypothetical protein